MVDYLENNGNGLNLTYEVRMAILGHTGDRIPETREGQIVRLADRIAYVNHDIDDAIRAGILNEKSLPRSTVLVLGESHSQRINTLVNDMVESSMANGDISLSTDVAEALQELRTFLFEKVYRNPVAKGEEVKAKDMLRRMYDYYIKNIDKLPADFQPQISFDGLERTVCDYIAGMTDNYAVDKFSEIFIPKGWHVRG